MQVSQLSSTSNSRQLRDRKRPRYDAEAVEEDGAGDLPKRRRQQRSSSLRKPKRTARLASFVDLPLDVLHEIFGHLHPYDLLKLARTTRDFRRILMHRSSVSTWRASFAEVVDLPECPAGMAEPAWANLVFWPHCHVCLKPGVRNVEWKFRIRMCTKCASNCLVEVWYMQPIEEVYKLVSGGFGTPAPPTETDLRYLVPNREGRHQRRAYMLRDLIEFKDMYKCLSTPEERLAFIDERQKALVALNMHAENCAAWASNEAVDRTTELTKLKFERKQAIVKKLEQLGYKKDLEGMRYPDPLDSQPWVNKAQRLTDRVWTNIKPTAISFMDQMRQKRLQREQESLAIARKADAGLYLQQVKNRLLPCPALLPGPPDFCDLPPVLEILWLPPNIMVTVSTFEERLSGTILALFDSWRNNMVSDLRYRVFLEEVYNVMERFEVFPGNTLELLNLCFAEQANANPASSLQLTTSLKEHRCDPMRALPSYPELDAHMRLASTVYLCKACACASFDPELELQMIKLAGHSVKTWGPEDPYTDYGDDRKIEPLFFPQVMDHPCNRRNEVKAGSSTPFVTPPPPPVKKDASTELVEVTRMVRTKCNFDKLSMDYKASEVAALVVQSVGLDPRVATSEDMDRVGARFQCIACPPTTKQDAPLAYNPATLDKDEPPVMPYYNWRAAIAHQVNHHVAKMDPSESLAPPDSEMRQPGPATVANLAILHPDAHPFVDQVWAEEERVLNDRASVWCCTHCRDTPMEYELDTLPGVKAHLAHVHDISNDAAALNEDFFQHYAAPDLLSSPQTVAMLSLLPCHNSGL
ncbi:hypothetical protein BKA70DRAFT_1250428 [Coprinopsis sp. MPI-PUGE-AT-0042]|nr:hypothetical protein BKA70DRAFT_1250428 [Coprinopsis sp. MPI-PUGE-AT-0042]